MRAQTGWAGLRYASPPVSLTGGFFAELLRFRLIDPPPELDRELVARIIPNEEAGEWESAVQRSVADQGFPTPAVRLSVDSTGPLGRYLIVMDAVGGRSPMADLGVGGLIRRFPALIRRLPAQLAGVAAALHRLDPGPLAVQLESLSSFPTTTAGFVGQMRDSAVRLHRHDIAEAAERVLESEPTSSVRVIAHGDLHPFNLLVADDGAVQLIDWTVSRVAHPGFTVGFAHLMLEHPPIALPSAAGRALDVVGRRMARRFLAEYRRLSSGTLATVDDVELDWHRRVHALRILVELSEWEGSGRRPDSGHPWVLLEPVARHELGLAVAGDRTGRKA